MRVAILFSLLYFRAVYLGFISKGSSFLTAAQFSWETKKKKKKRRSSPSTFLCTKESPPDISHTHQKMEVHFIKEEDVLSLKRICLSWVDRWDRSSNLTFSTFPYISNPSLSSKSLRFPCDDGPWLQGTHGDYRQSWVKAGSHNPFYFWHLLSDIFGLIWRCDLGS